ncbi:hypothetical protein E2C01_004193 [Portunus trituberculatus]|uniref:Uncharacterized protein n=1 Tax=Portunus trituberculatus TaxID=210409 RepID=A0A5B7CQQ9_PORTR|nr:hypothetical protein [Portunus trituberculatus]
MAGNEAAPSIYERVYTPNTTTTKTTVTAVTTTTTATTTNNTFTIYAYWVTFIKEKPWWRDDIVVDNLVRRNSLRKYGKEKGPNFRGRYLSSWCHIP